MQKDPSPGKLALPSSVVNSYSYTGNNPLNLTDATGQSFLGDLLAGILGAVAAAFAAPFALGALGVSTLTGMGGAVLSTVFGGISGALAGALTGGVVGGLDALAGGASFTQGFWHGAVIGAISGGIAGVFTGYRTWSSSKPLAESSLNGRQFAQTDEHLMFAPEGSVYQITPEQIGCFGLGQAMGYGCSMVAPELFLGCRVMGMTTSTLCNLYAPGLSL